MLKSKCNHDEQVAAASLLELLSRTDEALVQENPASSLRFVEEIGQQQLLEKASIEEHDDMKKLKTCSELQKSSEEATKHERQCGSLVHTTSNYTDKKKPTRGRSKKLPELLMEMLTNQKNEDSMRFLSDNENFVIFNTRKFREEIMPTHFKISKFGCFLNKLSKYGFTHAVLGDDQYIFFHPLFKKDNWDSLKQMKYRPMKAEQIKTGSTSALSRKRQRDDFETNLDIPSNPSSKFLRLDSSAFNFLQQLSTNNEAVESYTNVYIPRDELRTDHICGASERLSFTSSSSNSSLDSRSHLACSEEIMTSDIMQTTTKDVVSRAIDCLLYDETHTLDLLARRGKEVNSRRLSLPLSSCNETPQTDNIQNLLSVGLLYNSTHRSL